MRLFLIIVAAIIVGLLLFLWIKGEMDEESVEAGLAYARSLAARE